MGSRWLRERFDRSDFVPRDPVDGLMFKDLEQLASFFTVKNSSALRKRFQPVPFLRIVTGSDLETCRRVLSPDEHSAGRCCSDTSVKYIATRGRQPREHSPSDHLPTGTTIVRHDDRSAFRPGADCPSESRDVIR